MISYDDALQHIRSVAPLSETETIPLQAGTGRVLADPIVAGLTHPPDAMSAMDGYAVRSADAVLGATLTVIGESPAGHPFSGSVGPGECVRVFTGSVVPQGADHIVIQEDATRTGDTIAITDTPTPPRHIRAAGLDFKTGDTLIPAGTRLLPRQLSICAAANHATLNVIRKPRVALLANGDELRAPGEPLGPGEIIASNEYSLTALIEAWGGEVINLGIAPDAPADIRARIEGAGAVDLFVPVGGASVGDHDHMKTVFGELGFDAVFSKVAVRPGKPTWLSECSDQLVLGLPGNPASALVCAHVFLKPLIARLLGASEETGRLRAALTEPLPANGNRAHFMRGQLAVSEEGEQVVTPAANQDSALLSPFVTANMLIYRGVGAPAVGAGERVACLGLD